MPKPLEPHPVDIHVGRRVAVKRNLLKMSQQELANQVAYSSHQIQQYEKGLNRFSAGVLFEFCKTLGVPISFLFEGLTAAVTRLRKPAATAESVTDLMRDPDIVRLVRKFDRINDPESRQKGLTFIRAAATVLTELR